MCKNVGLEIVGFDICYNSVPLYEEPLVVSCERTVRAAGGLVKIAWNIHASTGCTLFAEKAAHCERPPQDLGPGTGHHQGRGHGQRAAATIENPGCL